MKCLILGNACTDAATMKYRGISQATSNWLTGLMRGIEKAGGAVTAFAHVHDALWPKGYLFPGEQADLEPSVKQVLVRYGNVPGLRQAWLTRALVRAVKNHVKEQGKPDVLLTYNLYPYYVDAAKIIQAKLGIPWIPIVLDLDDPELDSWKSFNGAVDGSRGAILLSWWGYQQAPVAKKLHLDGGGELLPLESATKQADAVKTVVYAGKIADYGGAKLLADGIRGVKNENVQFVICGKGKAEAIEEIAKTDRRVVLKGFVSDEELAKICQQADVFINPRPVDFQENKMIFPSKILFYLGYGAPLVSTWTPGLSPDYRDILLVPEKGDAESLAAAIDDVLQWPEERRLEYRAEAGKFLTSRSWEMQGRRLIEFVQNTLSA